MCSVKRKRYKGEPCELVGFVMFIVRNFDSVHFQFEDTTVRFP